MENMRFGVWLLLLMVALDGCGVRAPFQLSAPPVLTGPGTGGGVPTPVYLSGLLPLVGGGSADLEKFGDKPLVLMFASDTCDVCLTEANGVRDSLKDAKLDPNGVRFVTALVGVGPREAAAWKADNRLPWMVGWDEELTHYRAWCEGATVPCTVIQLPGKGVVFRHIGEMTPTEIRNLTGPWEVSL